MANIEVLRTGPDTYAVAVVDDTSLTNHTVTAVEAAAEEHGVAPKALVDASFRFLLDREPKEAILSRFDLGIISQYFPEYSSTIAGYLRG